MRQKETTLDSRLRNCLQTIFELEEALTESSLGSILGNEFLVLKKVAETLEFSSVQENDVQKIEKATMRFLEEIQQSVVIDRISLLSGTHLLQ